MDAIIEIWTDGSCSTEHPKAGGWAAIIRLPGSPFTEELSGGELGTTSQRMEMTALLRALERFTEPRHLVVHSDSAYVVNCFKQNWIATWRVRDWITSSDKPVANRDLWEMLHEHVERHASVTFRKVKGHAGHDLNERADELAGAARLEELDRFKRA